MNKTIATVSAAVAFGSTSLSAVVMPALADVNVTTDFTFASEYVTRGIERADESIQPSVEATFGDFYAGVWANLPATNNGGGQVDGVPGGQLTEFNYFGGFELYVPEWVGQSFDIGVNVYHFPDTQTSRTHEFYVGSNVDLPAVEGVSIGAYYYYDVDIRSHVLEASAGYSFSLEGYLPHAASFDVSAVVGKQFGGSMKDHAFRADEDYHYWGGSVEFPYHLTDASTVTAGVHYETAEDITLAGQERDNNLFWTVSYTAGF